ncbi:MAG TPA: IS1595 family transposase [Alphaproteobacteria bacterium]|nr:IS1595 family transposase [Alphaproteobacteria bacterium]
MTSNLTNPIYNDEEAARKHFEAVRWPDGPVCPHCGSVGNATELRGKSTRPGVYKCKDCRKPFSATVGTLFERSHIPLHKWLLATHLLTSSKKGMSAHQLWRMLGFGSYRTAWFMAHRIREAYRDLFPNSSGPLGGQNKVVEADETYVGGKARNRKSHVPPKEPVFSLVERGGKVRSHHVPEVSGKTLRPILNAHLDKRTYLMTDDATVYPPIAKDFAGHGTVNHSAEEYVRAFFWHTNTVENYFSILKRGITGTYHHVSQQHLKRYLAEFDFRYNERSALGVDDEQRATKALKGVAGKRLTYARTGERGASKTL